MHQKQGIDRSHKEGNGSNSGNRPSTPPRPPYSPVTPVFTQLAPGPGSTSIVPPGPSSEAAMGSYSSPSPTTPAHPPRPSAPTVNPEPAPVPISESENPDAIALRSTLSILQIQKQQSIRDIQTLDKIKGAAAADPEGFAVELAAGRLSKKEKGGFVEVSDERDDGVEGQESTEHGEPSRFGKIPKPQSVVRMPPVNWAKYQILGEPLDKMHEEQLRRPSPGMPRREEPAQRTPEHVLISPYRPLADNLETPAPAKRKSTSKGKKT